MTENQNGIVSYRDLRRLACHAEMAGLDSVWVCDHLLFRFDADVTRGTWEAATVAAAIGEATSRAEIGTLVMCTAFRNPALLAKMAVTLDEVTGGRLVLGLGAGWHRPELAAFGLPASELLSRCEEAVQVITALLRDGQASFSGRYYAVPDAELRPRGPRPAGIPILIGGEGPRMMRLAARFGDFWNTAWHRAADPVHERLAAFGAACKDTSRDPASIGATAGLDVRFGPPGEAESAEAVFRTFCELRRLGIRHAVCDVKPVTPDSITRLAAIANRAREAVPKEST